MVEIPGEEVPEEQAQEEVLEEPGEQAQEEAPEEQEEQAQEEILEGETPVELPTEMEFIFRLAHRQIRALSCISLLYLQSSLGSIRYP